MIERTEILKTAIKTIEVEIETLKELVDELSDDFVNCIQYLSESRGRLIVTGVGKSALVAQKVVATFNSTGTQAIYMHAADAVHGDLGMIDKSDTVILLSKSGETSEIKVLVPILKNFGNILIGITANRQSFLARKADHVLITPVSMEADPNKLAPTASTIAQMAVGDALASVLLKLRGFSHEHFAKFHPGGSLGKQLYLRVSDLFPDNEKPLVNKGTKVKDVIIEMTVKRLGVTVVCDQDNYILGIITDGDLRRMLEKNIAIENLVAEDIMALNPKTIEPDALAVDAFRLMQQNSITQIIVAESNKYVGVVHIHDLIREGMV